MTNLPRELRASLADDFRLATPAVARHDRSEDGTQKLVLRLADGRQIECVYIPDTPAQTFCVSTQVGCAMGCAFCLTGKMGLVRNLTAGEIAGQVRVLAAATGLLDAPFNIVLMGMGEPLHNYDATMKALRLLNEPDGLALPPKRVTLSTVGLVPMLDRLADEPLMPNLAISLHATTEEQRAAIVPPSAKYGAARHHRGVPALPARQAQPHHLRVRLLSGVNDSPADARRLARLLDGVKAKVNLIPLNAAAGIPFERPSDAAVDAFARILADKGGSPCRCARAAGATSAPPAASSSSKAGARPAPAQALAAVLG